MRNNDDADLEKYIELSGPQVWPSLSAIDVVDRYIFQRPEISYLRACDLIHNSPTIDDKRLINVRVRSCREESGKTRRTTISLFKHPIVQPYEEKLDKLKKVKSLLKKIREDLVFHLPNESIIDLQIEICLTPNEKNPETKVFFKRRWL